MEKKDSLVAKLNRRGFEQNLNDIKLCRQAYEGGSAFISKDNLFTHCRERAEEYNDRLKRAYYLNYTSPVVDTYSFFLFKNQVIRNFSEESLRLKIFMADCDKKGTSFDEFIKQRVSSVLISGGEFIVIDVPQEETLTLQDELEANKRPYLYTIKTEDVLDFEEDEKGLIWIKYIEKRPDKGGSWDYEGTGEKTVYVIWSRGLYQSYDKDGVLVDNIKLNIDFVPIVHVKFMDNKPIIRDIARVNRSLFNWSSLLDEILYRQTFSWLIVPGDKTETLSEKKIGTSWAWTFDPESKHVPQFISPDASQASTYETRCEKAIAEIYRMANLDWANSQMANKSGIAKAYDFMNVNKALSALAYTFQEAEKKIFKFVGLYYGENIDPSDSEITSLLDIYIQYPSDFSYTALSEKLSRLYEGLTTEFSKRFKKLCANQIVDSIFPMLNDTDKNEIRNEIDDFYDESDNFGVGDTTLENLNLQENEENI